MNTRNFKEKIIDGAKEGLLAKLILIVVAGSISLFPFLSIQGKLRKSLGDQPVILGGIYLSTFLLVFIIVFAIWKTRPGAKK